MSLPPNYNPNDSLLSGGDSAKIIPVQGGGFMPGGNYNADASLLSGGENAKIIPVQGGGVPPASTAGKAALAKVNEENEVPNASNIEDLDVYVLVEDEEFPSVNELSDTAEEESKTENEDEAKEAKPKALDIPCPVPDEDEVEELSDTFVSSNEAVDSKRKEVIRLVSREFYIRVPKRKSVGEKDDDDIMSDWKEEKFTEEEAEFLNTMGLSPKLLYTSFYCHDKDWKEELADFLYYLSVNTCYPASALVLRGECQRVREFLMIVESNLKAEKLRKLAEKPIPVAGPISLPELEEGEENENENNDERAGNSNDFVSIRDRMKNINVDDIEKEKERKSVAAKVANFFRGFFKGKPAKENAEDEILKELEKLNSNQSSLETPLLEGEEEEEENTSEKNAEERKAKIKSLQEEQLEEAFQEFLSRIPPEFRGMDPQILKKKYLSKGL